MRFGKNHPFSLLPAPRMPRERRAAAARGSTSLTGRAKLPARLCSLNLGVARARSPGGPGQGCRRGLVAGSRLGAGQWGALVSGNEAPCEPTGAGPPDVHVSFGWAAWSGEGRFFFFLKNVRE